MGKPISQLLTTRWVTDFLLRLAMAAPALFPLVVAAQDENLPQTPGQTQDAPVRPVDRDRVVLNFVGADLQSVVKTIGMITGKNFLLDPRVSGTVNIVSANPVEKELVYPIFLSALRLQGFTAVEAGGVTKIIPEADAKLNYSVTSKRKVGASGDKIITQVYPLQYENAAQLLPVLRPLISPNNVINAYPNTNTLVITDYAENIKRIDKIIGSIDVPQASQIHVMRLKNASALEVSQLMTRLIPEAAASAVPGTAARVAFAIDARTNSLIVRADNESTVQKIRNLVNGMDVPTSSNGNIHVVYLRNAEATKVAEALRAILSGDSHSAAPATATQPLGGAGGQGQAAAGQPQQQAGAGAATPVISLPVSSGGGSIQAYPSTNSLIVTAPDHVYNSIRSVIDKLDARRAQVLVEALIVEVTSTKAAEFGIQWQDLSGLSGTATKGFGGFNSGAGGASNNIIAAARDPTGLGGGLNIGIVRGVINFNGTPLLNLGFLARALESDQNTNILSTPNLLTIDNEEAKIVVGQNVPFVTGSQTSTTGGLANPFQTIERKDVGLTLRVKPQITEGGSVKLQIFQEVSSVSLTTVSKSTDLITDKRSIESTVLVDDGQIVVLGGLIKDDVSNNRDKVPVLGDIPLLGALFKYDTRRRVKTNLMVFLRPYVLRDSDASKQVTSERYDFIRNEQQGTQIPNNLLLQNMAVPVLPEYQPGEPKTHDYDRLNNVPFDGAGASRDAEVTPLRPPPGAQRDSR